MVINVLKNGEVVEDMSTITVPINDSTRNAYELIANQ